MKLKVGKSYKTRSGRKVRIYATDGSYPHSVHGALLHEDSWVPFNWEAYGKVYRERGALDIVGEWGSDTSIFSQNCPPEPLALFSAPAPTNPYVSKKAASNNNKCECGGASVGAGHSPWCPAFEGK